MEIFCIIFVEIFKEKNNKNEWKIVEIYPWKKFEFWVEKKFGAGRREGRKVSMFYLEMKFSNDTKCTLRNDDL